MEQDICLYRQNNSEEEIGVIEIFWKAPAPFTLKMQQSEWGCPRLGMMWNTRDQYADFWAKHELLIEDKWCCLELWLEKQVNHESSQCISL